MPFVFVCTNVGLWENHIFAQEFRPKTTIPIAVRSDSWKTVGINVCEGKTERTRNRNLFLPFRIRFALFVCAGYICSLCRWQSARGCPTWLCGILHVNAMYLANLRNNFLFNFSHQSEGPHILNCTYWNGKRRTGRRNKCCSKKANITVCTRRYITVDTAIFWSYMSQMTFPKQNKFTGIVLYTMQALQCLINIRGAKYGPEEKVNK